MWNRSGLDAALSLPDIRSVIYKQSCASIKANSCSRVPTEALCSPLRCRPTSASPRQHVGLRILVRT